MVSGLEKMEQTLFFWAPKSLQMATAAMKLEDPYSLEEGRRQNAILVTGKVSGNR